MLDHEARWLAHQLDLIPVSELSPMLAVASHTNRSAQSPAGRLVAHLEQRGVEVVGLDVVGDLTDPERLEGLRARGFRSVLCSHVLEHVPEPRLLARNLASIPGPGGHLVFSGPRRSSRRAEALAGAPRPEPHEVPALFPGTQVVAADEIEVQRGRRDARTLLHLLLPWLVRRLTVTCAVLRTGSVSPVPGGARPDHRPLRVLYVTKLSPELGLPHILEPGRRLAQRGHQVDVLCARTRRDQPRRRLVDGLRIRTVATAPGWLRERGAMGFFASRLPFYLVAPRIVRREYADVDVVIEDMAPLRSPRLPAVTRRLGLPLVYHTHNAYPTLASWTGSYGPLGTLGWVWDQWFRRRPQCQVLFTAARYTAESYEGIGCDVQWLPNGIDTSRFALPEGPRPEGAPLRLLSVGRVVDIKNHQLLVEAMAASRGTATLRIVGDGPARPYLESLVRLRGLEDRVTFTGHVAAGQVAAEYRHGDLFVMPSLWEGLPHVLLEAMASGLPIAISDIDAAKGIVEPEYGWILPTRSSAPWTALFDRLESDPTPLAEMGPRARKAAVAWADWDHITDRVELTLRGLCDCVG